MMLKLAGGIFVAVASFMNGYLARQSLSRRIGLLRQLRLGLELLQNELELRMASLPELFEAAGQRLGGEMGAFFQGTAVNMAAVTGRPLITAMKIQMEEQPLPLEQEEKSMLLELSGALGRYDLGGQARALELYKKRLDERIGQAESVRRQKAQAWMTASVCGGLALILILL